MPLPVLVAIVAIGVGLVVLAVHLTGGSDRAAISDAGEAKAVFAADFPDFAAETVLVLPGGHDAVLLDEKGHVGLVHAMGHKFLTRLVSARDLSVPPVTDGAALVLVMSDFTWPRQTLSFANEDDARAVAARLHVQRKAA